MADDVKALESVDEYMRIPPVDAARTFTLGTELLARRKKAPLRSGELDRDARRLRAAIAALGEASRAALSEDAQDKSVRKDASAARVDADRRLDRAWGAIEQRLAPWLTLEPAARPEHAQRLYDLLFGEGLEFLNAPYRSEWAESERRIGALREEKLEPALRALVSDVFVDALLAAHESYTRALGITAAPAPDAPRALPVDKALNNARSALRKYARQVVAQVDDEDAESLAWAHTLLAPIAQLRAEAAARAPSKSDPAEPKDGEDRS